MKKWVFLILTVLIVCSVFLISVKWQHESKASQEAAGGANTSSNFAATKNNPEIKDQLKKVPLVATEAARSETISDVLKLTGSVTATRVAKIASPGEGPVRNSCVREGDLVKAGQILLCIGRNKAAEAQMVAAEQSLKEQELELERVEKLVKNGAVPESLLDSARSKFKLARAQLAKARQSTQDYTLAAPWGGVVSEVLVVDGDFVAPRSPLVRIFDPASLVIQFAVPEAESTKVRTNMKLRVKLDAYPAKTFQARISRVYPNLEPRMRTRTVEAALETPVELIPGMFARIELFLKTVNDAVVVPAEAVQVTAQGDRFVWVFEDGKALRRKTTTGVEDGRNVQIAAGVRAGEAVIVSGYEKLKDGVPVRVQKGATS